MEYTNIIIKSEEKLSTFIKNNVTKIKINILIRKKKF